MYTHPPSKVEKALKLNTYKTLRNLADHSECHKNRRFGYVIAVINPINYYHASGKKGLFDSMQFRRQRYPTKTHQIGSRPNAKIISPPSEKKRIK